MENEEWKIVEGYFGIYEVSNYGRVRRTKTERGSWEGRILNGSPNKSGHWQVALYFMAERRQPYIHRLVATAFIPNPNSYPEVNHKDGDKTNNRVENLEWVTGQQNQDHAVSTGLKAVGTKNGRSTLTETEVLEIRSMFREGASRAEIARKYALCHQHVTDIVTRKIWKHLGE